MSDDKKVVWILGAGFSRSLGGPLFSELFTRESLEIIFDTYNPDQPIHQAFDLIVRLYLCGAGTVPLSERTKKYARIASSNHWDNSEHFIDKLNFAAKSDPITSEYKLFEKRLHEVRKTLKISTYTDFRSLVVPATKLLAAECSAFLENNPRTNEKWLPYKRWASLLNSNHTIISFNYDCVLEKLRDRIHHENGNETIFIPTPTEVHKGNVSKDKAIVYKLHGSVDWFRDMDEIRHLRDYPATDKHFLAVNDLALATPGPSKQELIKDTHLGSVWDKASQAIEAAKAIVFLGYRFPPTDSISRGRILGCIRNNFLTHHREPLIHTVLGSHTANDDSTRLLALLTQIGIVRGSIAQKPMGAEDYIDTLHSFPLGGA